MTVQGHTEGEFLKYSMSKLKPESTQRMLSTKYIMLYAQNDMVSKRSGY